MKLVKQQKEEDKMARIFYKKYGGQKKHAHANEGQLLHNIFLFILVIAEEAVYYPPLRGNARAKSIFPFRS